MQKITLERIVISDKILNVRHLHTFHFTVSLFPNSTRQTAQRKVYTSCTRPRKAGCAKLWKQLLPKETLLWRKEVHFSVTLKDTDQPELCKGPVVIFSVTLKDTNQLELCKGSVVACQSFLCHPQGHQSAWSLQRVCGHLSIYSLVLAMQTHFSQKSIQKKDRGSIQTQANFHHNHFLQKRKMKNKNQTHLSVTRSQFYLDLVTSLLWPTQSKSKTHTHNVMSPKSTHTHTKNPTKLPQTDLNAKHCPRIKSHYSDTAEVCHIIIH